MDDARNGIEEALAALGRGFLVCPRNGRLRDRLRTGDLAPADFFRQLLRLVYRGVFLLIVEDRRLLHDPGADRAARLRYRRHHSASRLRVLARRASGGGPDDLYPRVLEVLGFLADGRGDLGLRPMGPLLAPRETLPDLFGCALDDGALLEAVRAMGWTRDGRRRAFATLEPEALGGIYESLLDLEPVVDVEAGTLAFGTTGTTERKATGSYYTPPALVRCLLDSALDPLLDKAAGALDPAKAILSLRVCDPACGSGHFLLAAARRTASRLASVRWGEDEPPPRVARESLRDVIAHCIYGVDLNEMAVELCRMTLWLEMAIPSLPLSFLDHRVVCGNSIVGATPARIDDGIPDEAFRTGAPAEHLARLRRQNRRERADRGQALLWEDPSAAEGWNDVDRALRRLAETRASLADGLLEQRVGLLRLQGTPEFRRHRLVADAWCAAFAWDHGASPGPPPVTDRVFTLLRDAPDAAPAGLPETVKRLARAHRFHHWHLAFPEVFRLPRPGTAPDDRRTGWSGGFDVVLGNPPYLRDSRKRDLPGDLLALYRSATSHYDIYVLFMELALDLVRPMGVVSLVTSNGYIRQKYGAGIQQVLLENRLDMLLEVDYNAFSAGVKTCITTVTRGAAPPDHVVRMGCVQSPEALDALLTEGRGLIEKPLSWLKEQRTFALPSSTPEAGVGQMRGMSSTIPLGEIALVSLGMVFHDPRPGGRKKQDYLSDVQREPFTTPLLDGEHVERWGATGRVWLHHCPEEHREPRFPELFSSPKVLCRRIIGRHRPMALVDDAGLYFSDNVVGVVPLHGVQESGARIVAGYTPVQYEHSRLYSPHYLACLLNSRAFEAYARRVLGVGLHLYPGHVRQLPVPCLTPTEQEPFIRLSLEAHEAYRGGRPLEAIEADIEARVVRLFETGSGS